MAPDPTSPRITPALSNRVRPGRTREPSQDKGQELHRGGGAVAPDDIRPGTLVSGDTQWRGYCVADPEAGRAALPEPLVTPLTAYLKDGTVRTHTTQGFRGMPSQPFTWQDAVDKFDRLVDGRLDNSLSDEIKHAVRTLETIQTRDLTGLLARVPYPGRSSSAAPLLRSAQKSPLRSIQQERTMKFTNDATIPAPAHLPAS
jgi:hypothetical protein